MADKPSRAVVIYGYGLASSVDPSHSHIHAVASLGCCGFLSLHDLHPSPESEDGGLVGELAQLLDAYEASHNANGEKSVDSECQKSVPSISERFMGMRAALITNNSSVKSFGEKLGLTALNYNNLSNNGLSAGVALLKLLGFEDGKTLETNQYDLIFVHIGSHGVEDDIIANDLKYTNDLVGEILRVAQPGSEIGSRLHLTVIMSYGDVTEEDPELTLQSINGGVNSQFASIIPLQSYMVKGGKLRNGVRQHHPMLIAQWQQAVTRRDMVHKFSFDEFRESSGNLVIPADRFLHEIAFKLWKAPKYGA